MQRSVKGPNKGPERESEAETSTGRQPRVGGGQWAARATGALGRQLRDKEPLALRGLIGRTSDPSIRGTRPAL